MMNGKISKWQEVRLDFFREEVLSRFWNHSENTKNFIIEVQYMPALLCGEPERRVFMGAGITLDFPFTTRKNNIKTNFLKDGNLEGLKEYEKNHALGFVMTGDDEQKIDSITLCYSVKEPYSIFMQNFGVGYSKSLASRIIFLWYNLREDGKIEETNIEPGPNSMIRVRYIEVDYFMSVMKDYVESGYKNFPPSFTKDDYRV